MELYHGSTYDFTEIDLSKARKGKDFGLGYYLTTNKSQAIRWATRGKMKKEGFLYTYAFDEKILNGHEFNIKKLTRYNKEWADYLCKCRLEFYNSDHDIIYDRMADSTFKVLSNYIERYYFGEIDLNMLLLIARFPKNRRYDQYCFKTKRAIEKLSLVKKEGV